jgi:hypothetical protein
MRFPLIFTAIAFAGFVAARGSRGRPANNNNNYGGGITKRASPSVSQDGRCGSNGMTCLGSDDGSCCSKWGYCGSTESYCGTGCQSEFGSCLNNGQTEPSPPTVPVTHATTNQPVSTNSRCGDSGKGATCLGSVDGDCCSIWGEIIQLLFPIKFTDKITRLVRKHA